MASHEIEEQTQVYKEDLFKETIQENQKLKEEIQKTVFLREQERAAHQREL